MGGFYWSIHVRTVDVSALEQTLAEWARTKGKQAWLSPPRGDWTSIYPQGYGELDLLDILPGRHREDILALLVHDDDVFCYWYYCAGQLLDRYNSRPDYFGEDHTDEGDASGHPEVFQPLLRPEQVKSLREILETNSTPDQSVREAGQDLPEQINSFHDVIDRLKKLLQNPEEMKNFMKSHPELLSSYGDKFKSFTSLEALIHSPEMTNLTMKIAETFFLEQRLDRTAQPHRQKLPDMPRKLPDKYLFAIERMEDFAGLFRAKRI
jgi:hypothetical protein